MNVSVLMFVLCVVGFCLKVFETVLELKRGDKYGALDWFASILILLGFILVGVYLVTPSSVAK